MATYDGTNDRGREAIPTYWDNGDSKHLDMIAKGVGTLVVLNVIIAILFAVSLVLGIIAYSNLDDHVSDIDQNTNAVQQGVAPTPAP
jgi:hypothetical protein